MNAQIPEEDKEATIFSLQISTFFSAYRVNGAVRQFPF